MWGIFVGENLIFFILAYNADLRFEGRSQRDIFAKVDQDGRSVHFSRAAFRSCVESKWILGGRDENMGVFVETF